MVGTVILTSVMLDQGFLDQAKKAYDALSASELEELELQARKEKHDSKWVLWDGASKRYNVTTF
jgi:hypothetical protein